MYYLEMTSSQYRLLETILPRYIKSAIKVSKKRGGVGNHFAAQ